MRFIPIKRLLDQQPVAVILRHAERQPIVNWQDVDKPLLTERGQQDAVRLGERFAAISPLQIYYSPVPRCRQTAEAISCGISNQSGRCNILGSLSELTGKKLLKDNWDDIVSIVEKHGWSYFCRKWFDGEWPEGLVMPLKKAAYDELTFLLEQLEGKKTSTVHVTHDFVISVLREYFFALRFKDVGVPEPLDTIAAYLSPGKIHLLYQEHECVAELPLKSMAAPRRNNPLSLTR